MSINDPVNENSPNWFLYRLTMDRMKSLRDVSTHWRATCSYDKYGINNYKDYVRGKFADTDIFAFLGLVAVIVLRPSLSTSVVTLEYTRLPGSGR